MTECRRIDPRLDWLSPNKQIRRRIVQHALLGPVATLFAAGLSSPSEASPTRSSLTTALAAASPEKLWKVGERVEFPPLVRLDGSAVDWNAYRGRVLLVEFWATWCPFCARQNAMLERFLQDHRHRGLAMMGISIDKTAEAPRVYLERHKYSFEAAMATPAWQAIFRQRRGLPQLFVLSREGRLVQIELGEMLDEDVAELSRHL